MSKPVVDKMYETLRSELFSNPEELKYRAEYFRELLKDCDNLDGQRQLRGKIKQFRTVIRVFEPIEIKSKRGKKAA